MRIACIGPLVMDRLSLPGGAVHAVPGGNAVIFAATAAHRGVPVTLFGQVGADPDGALIRKRLDAHGVDTSMLRAVSKPGTKTALLRVTESGDWLWERSEPRVFPYLAQGQLDALDPRRWHLHVAGLPPLLRAAPGATRDAVARWREAGRPISAGLARFGPEEREALLALLDPQDLLFGTVEEVKALGTTPARCVATLGPAGALARWDGGEHRAAPQACKAVCTVGAGDVLSAVCLAAWMSGSGAPEALRQAVAAASASVASLTWYEWMGRT